MGFPQSFEMSDHCQDGYCYATPGTRWRSHDVMEFFFPLFFCFFHALRKQLTKNRTDSQLAQLLNVLLSKIFGISGKRISNEILTGKLVLLTFHETDMNTYPLPYVKSSSSK